MVITAGGCKATAVNESCVHIPGTKSTGLQLVLDTAKVVLSLILSVISRAEDRICYSSLRAVDPILCR